MSESRASIHALIRRLAETPPPFREAPQTRAQPGKPARGVVHVGAVVGDLLRELGGPGCSVEEAEDFRPVAPSKARLNLARVQLIACHLLHDSAFRSPDAPAGLRRKRAELALKWLHDGLSEVSGLVPARDFIQEQDRREELVRLALRALEMQPEGESAAQAEDRLATLDSAERKRLVEKSRQAQRRAEELRRKLQEERAQEAASKMMRE